MTTHPLKMTTVSQLALARASEIGVFENICERGYLVYNKPGQYYTVKSERTGQRENVPSWIGARFVKKRSTMGNVLVDTTTAFTFTVNHKKHDLPVSMSLDFETGIVTGGGSTLQVDRSDGPLIPFYSIGATATPNVTFDNPMAVLVHPSSLGEYPHGSKGTLDLATGVMTVVPNNPEIVDVVND